MTDTPRRSLAIRYRPRRFAELTGQRHVAAVLGAAIEADTVTQQILLLGDSGLGKTTVARIAAAAVLCETPLTDRVRGDACGHCESCLDVTDIERIHPDVIELDAASHGGKDDIKELAARATLAPLRGKKKIYIVDEVHGLSGPGGQAFLKLLEEPPAHCLFLLATTDPQKMLATNRGRCIQFELLRPTDEELTANLRRVATGEGWTLSDRAAHAVLAATEPALGVRGTLMTLEKLAAPLTSGTDPDDDALAVLLGVPPAALVTALTAAIVAHDRPAAHAALTALRSRSSDTVIRAALAEWARAEFIGALRPGSPVASELALWRYETLAAAPPGAVWTDIAVARLAAPRLEASAEALAAMLAQAEQVIGRLTDATRAVGPTPGSTPATQPAPVPATPPSATKPATTPVNKSAGNAGPIPPPPAPEAAVTREPVPTAGQSSSTVEEFTQAVAGASRVAGAMLRSCTVTVEGADIVLTALPALAARITGQLELLNVAAGELGYGLRVTS